MKNVRLLYKKSGPLKFVSHLDMNRFMTRLLRLSKVPVWYTEGFNKHPYITFALPLSLGFCSDYEVMDFRLNDDDFPVLKAKEMIKAVCPNGMEIIDLVEPKYKSGKIAMADFEIVFADDSLANEDSLKEFMSNDEIWVSKKTKKGTVKEFNAKEKIVAFEVLKKESKVLLKLRLPAGGEDNLNPKIITSAYFEKIGSKNPFCQITRKKLLLSDGNLFI